MTYDLKKHLTKKNKISAVMAIIAVIILAIPSGNNRFTECGVGSVYSHGKCELTLGGAIKLAGAFTISFYLALLVLERREKENELEAELKKAEDKLDEKITMPTFLEKKSDEEVQAKIDDSLKNDDDYKNIPF